MRLRLTDKPAGDWAGGPFASELRRHPRRPASRSRRVLRDHRPRVPDRGRGAGDAPGVCRPAVVQAVLPLRREGVARGRPGAARPSRGARTRTQSRVDAPLQRRRHLDARQVGVPLVRRVGSRLPLRAAGAGRSRVRQGAARADAARVVHAPERPATGLRVGVRRREPAGARLGGVARLQDREAASRRGRPRLPGTRLPQAAAELHLVGEPQGRRGPQRLPGRVPRPRQHRRVRPERAAADRRPPRAVGRHELDGDVLPQHARDRPRTGRATTRPTRTSRASSGSTSSTSRTRWATRGGDEGVGLWDDEDGFFYDVLHLPNGDQHPLKVRSHGRTHPALRGRDDRARGPRAAARRSGAGSSGSSSTGPT